MNARSVDYSKKLSRFTQQIEAAPPERASAALFHAGILLVLAGRGSTAYIAFSYLLEGSLRLSHQSSLLTPFEQIWLPGLCHAMRLPCPATRHSKKRSPLELARYIRQHESDCRFELLLDRGSVTLPTEVNHLMSGKRLANQANQLDQRTNADRKDRPFEAHELPSSNDDQPFHAGVFRLLQLAAQKNRLADAIACIEHYDAENEGKARVRRSRDWIAADIRMLAIDTYFRAGNEQEANAHIIKWWHESPHDLLVLSRLVSFARVFRAIVRGVLIPI